MFEEQLQFAAAALASGNLAASEIVCRNILDSDHRNAAALNLLGIIAGQVGAVDRSAAYFKAALRAAPNEDKIRGNLKLLKKRPPADGIKKPGRRYLLIKSWGYGFWSDVSQVLGTLLLAEITDRIPVTHWGTNSLFGDGSNDDAFKLYFEPVSNVSLYDLARVEDATFFPQKWNSTNLAAENVAKWYGNGSRAAALYFLNRPEMIAVNDFYIGVVDVAPWVPVGHPTYGKPLDEIYRYLIKKYLLPRKATHDSCDAFFRAHLNGGPFLAVHLRGSDKVLEDQDLHTTNQAYFSAIDSIESTWRIFLLTDDEQLRTQMISAYGDRIITTDCQRTSTSTGVHYLPSVKRVQAGSEVMTDTYLSLRANRFVGNGSSNVSAMIDVLKDWKPGETTLVGRSLLMQRNLYIHLRQ
jgi:protein O-GlcNAc transferase